MKVTVLVTLLNDIRVARTLEGLGTQTRRPDEVLVADGGSQEKTLLFVRQAQVRNLAIRLESLPGSVAESRNAALPRCAGDIVAFLDADEVPPPDWLDLLVAPIEDGEADFTGGPTRPFSTPRSKTERYLDRHDDWFYRQVVPNRLEYLPMGNSAWRRDLLERIGGFDPRLVWGGEDYDVNLRALRAGARGSFVPAAWVYHDQSHVDTLRKLMRRKYRYMVGATMAYRKNGVAMRQAGRSARVPARFRHRYEWLAAILKPVAFLSGLQKAARIVREAPREG